MRGLCAKLGQWFADKTTATVWWGGGEGGKEKAKAQVISKEIAPTSRKLAYQMASRRLRFVCLPGSTALFNGACNINYLWRNYSAVFSAALERRKVKRPWNRRFGGGERLDWRFLASRPGTLTSGIDDALWKSPCLGRHSYTPENSNTTIKITSLIKQRNVKYKLPPS